MNPEKNTNYVCRPASPGIPWEMVPRFNPASRHTACPNSLDCYNGHYYLITTDHMSGARFPRENGYHSGFKSYLATQRFRKSLWVFFTLEAIYALYEIHYGATSAAGSPCRPALHNGTEAPKIQDKQPSLVMELQWTDFLWCLSVIFNILMSIVLLWKADAVLEEAVDMRRRRRIHGLPDWPPVIPRKWVRVGLESWGANLGCFLVTLAVTVVWCWSVWLKVDKERGCRILLN
ncbi:hypothetical protein TWF481_010952 [Arthrobotrys musiformis]|uniref:Uncharacterized protein n=1 Tax=Arthrobotrys musiformis TaxID=47236 RepID=A0AAV9VWV1_9PEZI